jgi:hypothetical protein
MRAGRVSLGPLSTPFRSLQGARSCSSWRDANPPNPKQHILHPNIYNNTPPGISMKLLTLCNADTKDTIPGVNLCGASAEPIGKIFQQIANLLAGPKTILGEVKHLNNVLLLSILPHKPCLAKADVTPSMEQHSAAHSMCSAGLAVLGLTHAYHFDLRPPN